MARISAIGAYAFGLLELRVVANLWLDLAGAALVAAAVRRARRAVHLAPPRHLLRLADDRFRPGVLVRRGQMAFGHRRRGRSPQPAPPPRGLRIRRLRSEEQRRVVLFRVRRVRARRDRALASRAFSVRPHPDRDQAERDARRVRRIQRLALQVARLHDLRGHRRRRGRALCARAAVRVSQRDEPALVGIRRDDGAGRRGAS